MAITVSLDDVRSALDGDSSEYPDADIQFEARQAEGIVNDELAPYSSNTNRLELTGALLAAAYVEEDGSGPISSVQQASRQISFDTADALSLWRQAKQQDPTGKLEQLEKPTASIDVPRTRD